MLADATPLELVAPLAELFGTAADAGPADADSARTATERFGAFYHHAAPFSRRRLAALWDGCETDPLRAPDCRRQRRSAELALGPLP